MTPGSGYSADVTRRVVGVTYRQLVYWDKTGLIRPSQQRARGRGSRRLYTFEDLVELRVVAQLLGAGIRLPTVRKAAQYLRQHFQDVTRPLARLALQTDGKRVLVATTDRRHLVDATANGQLVIAVAVGAIMRDLKSRVAELRAPTDMRVKVGAKHYRAILTSNLEVGGFTVEVPELRGVVTEADTLTDARTLVVDAIKLWLATTQRSLAASRAR